MISHDLKLIFIAVPKCAGSSVEERLFKEGGAENAVGWWHHTFLSDYYKQFGARLCDKYTKVAFVRNPWDLEVSYYHFTRTLPHFYLFLRTRLKHTVKLLLDLYKPRKLKLWEKLRTVIWIYQQCLVALDIYECKRMSFENYIRRGTFRRKRGVMGYTQLRVGKKFNGLDYALRFESIERDWGDICQKLEARLGRKLPDLSKPLPKANVTNVKKGHYSTYYDEETKALVADEYREYIREFGYAF